MRKKIEAHGIKHIRTLGAGAMPRPKSAYQPLYPPKAGRCYIPKNGWQRAPAVVGRTRQR